MSLTIKGQLVRILDVESGTSKAGKQWKKQSFLINTCLLYTSPSPRDVEEYRMPSSA